MSVFVVNTSQCLVTKSVTDTKCWVQIQERTPSCSDTRNPFLSPPRGKTEIQLNIEIQTIEVKNNSLRLHLTAILSIYIMQFTMKIVFPLIATNAVQA